MQPTNQTQNQQPQNNNNQLQVLHNNVYALEESFNQLATKVNVKFKSEAMFAMQAMNKNEFLATTAARNQQSLKNAVLNVAALGLTLNHSERQCYLVPRKGEVCLDISYIGLCTLATRSGSMKFVVAKIVHSNDVFKLNGFGKEPTHEYEPFGVNRGVVVGVYCVAKTAGGEFMVDHMTIERCHEIRNRTDSWKKFPNSGAWHSDEAEMMKKTIIKQASKLWPKIEADSEFRKAIDLLNQHEGIDFEAEREAKAQAKEVIRIEARAKIETEREERTQLVNVTIKKLCSDLTTGMTVQDKGKFLCEHLGVNSFNQLEQYSIDELKTLVEKLTSLKGLNHGTSPATIPV